MKREQRRVPFGRSVIDYGIERSARRETVTIAIDACAGVVIKAPANVTMGRLDDIVKTKAPWILQRLVELREVGPRPAPKEFVAGEGYSYLGRSYRLKIKRLPDTTKPFASLHGAFLAVALPRGDMAKYRDVVVKRAVVAWYRRQADRRLPERVEVYASRAGVSAPSVLVREQEKRWGSCNSKGELRFNWRVMMAPMSLVDYVVAHEVCHLVVHNHSARFWKLLRTILPDYEERRARLRVEGVRFNL
jgi:predicted metal-dependent hydrolase